MATAIVFAVIRASMPRGVEHAVPLPMRALVVAVTYISTPPGVEHNMEQAARFVAEQ